jgi:hypothetical protein
LCITNTRWRCNGQSVVGRKVSNQKKMKNPLASTTSTRQPGTTDKDIRQSRVSTRQPTSDNRHTTTNNKQIPPTDTLDNQNRQPTANYNSQQPTGRK